MSTVDFQGVPQQSDELFSGVASPTPARSQSRTKEPLTPSPLAGPKIVVVQLEK